jgi:hypothetical protein
VVSVAPRGECELHRALTTGANFCGADIDVDDILGRHIREAIRSLFIVARDPIDILQIQEGVMVRSQRLLCGLVTLTQVSYRRTSLRGRLKSYIWPWCGVHISSLKSLSRWKLGRFCRPSQGRPLCWARASMLLPLGSSHLALQRQLQSLGYSFEYDSLDNGLLYHHSGVWGTALVRRLSAEPRPWSHARRSRGVAALRLDSTATQSSAPHEVHI